MWLYCSIGYIAIFLIGVLVYLSVGICILVYWCVDWCSGGIGVLIALLVYWYVGICVLVY